MPEGDTVFHTAAALRDALVGKTLTRCDVRVPRFAAVNLSGERVDEVLSRGKHLFIRAGAASIHSHLKMDGSWRIGPVRAAAYKVRIVLAAGNVTASGVDLGVLEILERATDLEAVAHLGPDLLGTDWSAATAAANLTTDLDRLPARPVGALTDPLRVVTRAQQMLWANRFRSNRTTTGDTRRGRELWVYGRAGLPCRRCGTRVATDNGGERVTYWCPVCQH